MLQQPETPARYVVPEAASRDRYIHLSEGTIPLLVSSQLRKLLQSRPKQLHPSLCYDAAGSRIFTQLCKQPEYYLTRIEKALLFRESDGFFRATSADCIVDLGCGNFEKTQSLIHAAIRHVGRIEFVPCDIDASIISNSIDHLRHFYQSLVSITACIGCYEDCLAYFEQDNRTRLFTFLGSTFGNMTYQEQVTFLDALVRSMHADDRFLIGIDLVKQAHLIEAAYNDKAGFARQAAIQMLAHLNREFEGDFKLKCFDYRATYYPEEKKVRSLLVSLIDQTVTLKSLGFTVDFVQGEEIQAEFMEKFELREFLDRAARHGLRPMRVTVDETTPYALVLFAKEIVYG